MSCCNNNNCENSQEPEYQKCYKPQNNSGCGCNGAITAGASTTTTDTGPTTTTYRTTRTEAQAS